MATLTVYPEPGVTVDGRVREQYSISSGVSWTTIVNDAGNGNDSASTLIRAPQFASDDSTDTWRLLRRSIMLFDTSALTSGATISAATLSLYGTAKLDDLSATPTTNIYSSAPASDTTLADGDFNSLGSTAFATAITYASWSTVAYNDFTLNASGLAGISKTGITKMGTRNPEYDVADSSPTWADSVTSYTEHSSSDHTGTTQDPKMVITYTAGSTFKPRIIMF